MDALENLVKIGQLHREPPDQNEFSGMLESARLSLTDAGVEMLSLESRFMLAYNASHALARAALRWHGYRSDRRDIVFQCLAHTVGLDKSHWRVLSECHRRRNLAEYEGHVEVDAQLFRELMSITVDLLARVEALGPVD